MGPSGGVGAEVDTFDSVTARGAWANRAVGANALAVTGATSLNTLDINGLTNVYGTVWMNTAGTEFRGNNIYFAEPIKFSNTNGQSANAIDGSEINNVNFFVGRPFVMGEVNFYSTSRQFWGNEFKLKVWGSVHANALCYQDSDCVWGHPNLDAVISRGGTTSNVPTFNGGVFASAYFYTSDKSLKENIKPLTGSLDKITALEGVSFNWKESGKKSLGLIAQDVEKVFPELVSTNASTSLKSVEYGNLVAPLIEAVKEQQKQIDELKRQVQELQNRY
jgi:hypothetical protein